MKALYFVKYLLLSTLMLLLQTTFGQTPSVTRAEYFMDTDPGAGNGIALPAADGNFSSALEAVLAAGLNFNQAGSHSINIRVMDRSGNWSPVFTRPITVIGRPDSINIIQAEYFIDTDPGQGNASPLLAFDGNFNTAFETVAKSGLNFTAVGKHTLNMRVMNHAGNWSPVFTMSITVLGKPDSINITQAEYYIDTDPGTGAAIPMLAFDGNFNAAFERVTASSINFTGAGKHTLNIRVLNHAGNWSPVFTMPITALGRPDSISITQAEYFLDTDPGQGNANTMLAFDGNFNTAFETVTASSINLTAAGFHTLNIRVLNHAGSWSAVFTTPLTVIAGYDTLSITQAEYFIDTDPGQGSGTAMLAFDGNFNQAFETATAAGLSFATGGTHSLNIRVRNHAGNWSPVFTTAVTSLNRPDNVSITQAEYFIDTDPGQGSATTMLAFDGNFNQAFETAAAGGLSFTNKGTHSLNIRVRNHNGNWSPVFTTAVTTLGKPDSISITQAEYFIDTDPGQGNATTMLAFDGNFNQAFETATAGGLSFANKGTHSLNIRVRNHNGNWSPVFTTVVTTLGRPDSISITQAEYFIDTDPGQGSAIAMLAFDGNFNQAFETATAGGLSFANKGTHSLNIRVRNHAGNWSPVFTTAVTSLGRPDNISITQAEYFLDTDPGQGSAIAMLAFDGNFNQAFETATAGGLSFATTGTHSINMRVMNYAGNWSPVFTTAVTALSPANINITQAEYFIDIDPGQGNAHPMLAFDGNFNAAFEKVTTAGLNFANAGNHTLNIRIKNNTGTWSPVFSAAISALAKPDNISIAQAEYFIDTDPGQGNATPMLAFDGNFNAAFEKVTAGSLHFSAQGAHTLNLRIKDNAGNWSTVFTNVIVAMPPADNIALTTAEYFIDTDPGEGNATAMLATDGNYNTALEKVKAGISFNAPGAHTINLRVQDAAGNWSPVFTTVVNALAPADNIQLIAAEYFWDTDPGQGNGHAVTARDGNFNQAFEKLYQTITAPHGAHLLSLRVQDNSGNWSPAFSSAVYNSAGYVCDTISITAESLELCPGVAGSFIALINGADSAANQGTGGGGVVATGGGTGTTTNTGGGGGTTTNTGSNDNLTYYWQINGMHLGPNGSHFINDGGLPDSALITCYLTSTTCPDTSFSNTLVVRVHPMYYPSVYIETVSDTVCAGSEVSFDAQATLPGYVPVYQWMVNGLNVGDNNYYYYADSLNDGDVVSCLLVSDDWCAVTDSAMSNTLAMAVHPLSIPSVTLTADNSYVCAGNTTGFTASTKNGGSAPMFWWFVDSVFQEFSGNTFSTALLNDSDFVYCVLSPSPDACVYHVAAVSDTVVVTVIPDCTEKSKSTPAKKTTKGTAAATIVASVFPNPAAGHFYLQLNGLQQDRTLDIKIYNATGQLIYSALYNNAENNQAIEMNSTEDLAAGYYMVQVKNAEFDFKLPVVISAK